MALSYDCAEYPISPMVRCQKMTKNGALAATVNLPIEEAFLVKTYPMVPFASSGRRPLACSMAARRAAGYQDLEGCRDISLSTNRLLACLTIGLGAGTLTPLSIPLAMVASLLSPSTCMLGDLGDVGGEKSMGGESATNLDPSSFAAAKRSLIAFSFSALTRLISALSRGRNIKNAMAKSSPKSLTRAVRSGVDFRCSSSLRYSDKKSPYCISAPWTYMRRKRRGVGWLGAGRLTVS